MQNVVATITDSGPIQIAGDVEMLDGAGVPYRKRKTLSLCRCGKTKRAPYCDASHERFGFEDACRASSFNGGNS